MKSCSYALGHTPREYERLRGQARVWEAATGRLLDQVGLARGATCLDAGCGPGETMRLMAHRVGPGGRVTGIDVDAELGAAAQAMLHDAGHRHCRVEPHDLTADDPIPGGPYDLVFARLLLFHLPQRVEVLRRLWEAVTPGGHLVLQDYDLRPAGTVPVLDSAETAARVVTETFTAMGCDVQVGAALPARHRAASDRCTTGARPLPDGTARAESSPCALALRGQHHGDARGSRPGELLRRHVLTGSPPARPEAHRWAPPPDSE